MQLMPFSTLQFEKDGHLERDPTMPRLKPKLLLYTIPSLTIVGIAPKNNLPKLYTCYMTSKL